MRLDRKGPQQLEQSRPINYPRSAADTDDQTGPNGYFSGIALYETRCGDISAFHGSATPWPAAAAGVTIDLVIV